jgi:hypothetical protein
MDRVASTATFVAHQLGRAIPRNIPTREASAVIGPNRTIREAHIELDIATISIGIEKRDVDLAKTPTAEYRPISHTDGRRRTRPVHGQRMAGNGNDRCPRHRTPR